MFKSMIAFIVIGVAFVTEAYEVRNVSANSRWPWNGLVYVDYELVRGDSPDQLYSIDVSATTEGGVRKLYGGTIVSGRLVGVGRNRLVWDFGKDYPDVIAHDLEVTVTATPKPVHPGTELYCVIDLSDGPDATYYPVRYETTGPDHVQGASGEKCQTTEMWFRRVGTGPYPFHGTDSNSGKGYYQVRFSNPFYCAVFECTQQQWSQVMGTWPSAFTNEACRASRPVETIAQNDILGQCNWPDNKTVTAESFVGRIRARTGLKTFNLPTEGQWEYACRAGATRSSFNGTSPYMRCKDNSGTVSNFSEDVSVGTAYVGTYSPNKWGIYDILGNVGEWLLDTWVADATLKELYAAEIEETGFVTDPQGPANTASSENEHCVRGGYYGNSTGYCTVYARGDNEHYSATTASKGRYGARFVITCE